ncbi:outer membrane protein OmpA-like peptidoglycan-associated protein [Microvirga flocculans]|uniref:Outer membrane protein OmpA-like peptidoglycan-associated protein n=1 Tax=Microvirga flocculans TaxID=217168 RepID=A0A7W6IHG0_9HYPH|nr:OmpA family protein [Microvirga flocculans]MBB4040915.1 outer membrane protein OmpA-like peptidoglycan-associated protein [Microvirga flocculans]
MKLSSLFLVSTALPLVLLPASVSALQPGATAPLVMAQASPGPDEELPPKTRQKRPGQQDADSPRGRQGQERRQGPQDGERRGGSEERGQRPSRDAGPAERGGPDATRGSRAPGADETPEAPRQRREQGRPAERPVPPSGATPATPARPEQQAPAERARPPVETPSRQQRPAAQDRDQERERPAAERPRSGTPTDEIRRPAAPSAAQPATPPASDRQRTGAPRPGETERPSRSGETERPDIRRDGRPSQQEPVAPAPATRAQPAPLPAPVQTAPQRSAPVAAQPLDPSRVRIEDLRSQRRERREGDRLIIEEPGNRTIIREGNDVIIRHDETERFRRTYRDADIRVERRGPGEEVTIVRRPDGSEIVTVRDDDGNLIRRIRREPAGREIVLIENRRSGIDRRPGYGYVEEEVIRMPPPVVRIPREQYIVETERASEADILQAFTAPPVERIERAYTLDEIRRSESLRERMRRVDLDTINFEFGSWELPPDQIDALRGIADGLRQAISRNPNEIFLVEGHTDAVGSDEDNLTLSDRRAETVATILTQRYQIPAENLTTQGYGEQYLKVASQGPERENRRVTLRRITPLLQGQNQQ